MKKKIGLIVNPIAGMGGSVGLKGTDGTMYKKAIELGAKPVTPYRTKDVFEHITHKDRVLLYTAPGKMGEDYTNKADFEVEVVDTISQETSADDTKRIAKVFVDKGIELLIFVGGDGTARDIYDAVATKITVIAVPSGVKVFSSVFAVSARAAAEMIDAFIERTDLKEEEVLDIDEDSFRKGILAARLYGYLSVPDVPQYLQGGKQPSSTAESSVKNKKEVAHYIVQNMEKDTLYLLGPGTTLKAIADETGVDKTLLGIDGVYNKKLVGSDLNEQGILDLFQEYEKKKIIVTPIGGNGFIFGRGSKQFTPEVIKQVGRNNIIVVGTGDKINKLDFLRVDTGDYQVDTLLRGAMKVIVGNREEVVMEVYC